MELLEDVFDLGREPVLAYSQQTRQHFLQPLRRPDQASPTRPPQRSTISKARSFKTSRVSSEYSVPLTYVRTYTLNSGPDLSLPPRRDSVQ